MTPWIAHLPRYFVASASWSMVGVTAARRIGIFVGILEKYLQSIGSYWIALATDYLVPGNRLRCYATSRGG